MKRYLIARIFRQNGNNEIEGVRVFTSETVPDFEECEEVVAEFEESEWGALDGIQNIGGGLALMAQKLVDMNRTTVDAVKSGSFVLEDKPLSFDPDDPALLAAEGRPFRR